jgi:hypothetical protein
MDAGIIPEIEKTNKEMKMSKVNPLKVEVHDTVGEKTMLRIASLKGVNPDKIVDTGSLFVPSNIAEDIANYINSYQCEYPDSATDVGKDENHEQPDNG